jgi:hypothetical protein
MVVGLSLVVVGCGKKDEAATDTAAASASAAPSAAAPVATPAPTPTVVVPKVDYTADANAVSGCCAALKAEEGKAKPADKSKYTAAAAVCGGLVESIKKGQSSRASVMGTLRAQMKGGSLPAGCN